MKQRGFTLIELVVVIVILGILAATALPKFADLSADARKAALQGLDGAIKSAANIAYAKASVSNQLGATGSVTVSGAAIGLVYGYPDKDSIDDMLQDMGGATFAAGAGTTATFTLQTNCLITYTQATSATVPATTGRTEGGC